jgi:hypothetical protein
MKKVVSAVALRAAEFGESVEQLAARAELGVTALTTAVANLVKVC